MNDSAWGVFSILLGIALFFAWLTHVVLCLKAASWGLLIAGAVFFPIGIVHGIGLWFGWFTL
tara:strand:+ start:259 stop:444 length:186 start_codon:yes stop_codon:yes gene_type:complete